MRPKLASDARLPQPGLDEEDDRFIIGRRSRHAPLVENPPRNVIVDKVRARMDSSSPGGGTPGPSSEPSPPEELDSLDQALVLRADRLLWPIIADATNRPDKDNAKTPGRFLVRPEWGTSYIALIDLFLDIKNVAPLGSLSTTGMPYELGYWKKRHRVCMLRRDLDVKGRRLPEELRAWWVTLQPPERIMPNGSLSITVPGGLDWSNLRVGGGNGLVVLVVGLAMWREGLDASVLSGHVTQWEALVNDVRSVFACLSLVSPVPPLSPPGTQPKKRTKVHPPSSQPRVTKRSRHSLG
jgi:hypothetical protein